MTLRRLAILALLWAVGYADLLAMQRMMDARPTHNAAGGYIDACGELPGLVGDDC
jgi:hypothetical protein